MHQALLESMMEPALSKSKAYRFDNQPRAMLFMRVCFKKALEDCGVFCPPKLKTETERQLALKKLMSANGVRVERSKRMLFDEWWQGLFIFKAGELVAFATEPRIQKPSAMSTEKYLAYTVRTNIRL